MVEQRKIPSCERFIYKECHAASRKGRIILTGRDENAPRAPSRSNVRREVGGGWASFRSIQALDEASLADELLYHAICSFNGISEARYWNINNLSRTRGSLVW